MFEHIDFFSTRLHRAQRSSSDEDEKKVEQNCLQRNFEMFCALIKRYFYTKNKNPNLMPKSATKAGHKVFETVEFLLFFFRKDIVMK